jgi:hypothetical protein
MIASEASSQSLERTIRTSMSVPKTNWTKKLELRVLSGGLHISRTTVVRT